MKVCKGICKKQITWFWWKLNSVTISHLFLQELEQMRAEGCFSQSLHCLFRFSLVYLMRTSIFPLCSFLINTSLVNVGGGKQDLMMTFQTFDWVYLNTKVLHCHKTLHADRWSAPLKQCLFNFSAHRKWLSWISSRWSTKRRRVPKARPRRNQSQQSATGQRLQNWRFCRFGLWTRMGIWKWCTRPKRTSPQKPAATSESFDSLSSAVGHPLHEAKKKGSWQTWLTLICIEFSHCQIFA